MEYLLRTEPPVAYRLVALFMSMMQKTGCAAGFIIATPHDAVKLYLQIYVYIQRYRLFLLLNAVPRTKAGVQF